MANAHIPSFSARAPDGRSPEERLEHGEILFWSVAPFALPADNDRAFLFEQNLSGPGRKHISHNPLTGETTGFAWRSADAADRLKAILSDFSRTVTAWFADALPRYRGGCEPDRASFRPEEEATRRLRLNARNDLLHVDAFPTRPARGRRILRIYANIHPTDPRIWATSEPLPQLLSRYRSRLARSRAGWILALGAGVRSLLRPEHERHSTADLFMLRLHDALKRDVRFQSKGTRRLWRFPPGSAWLAMTDGCTHAELRGRFALEHSFFISPQVLACPDLAPAALIGAA
jgi:hypothetical protein